jgi:hypothetical protein
MIALSGRLSPLRSSGAKFERKRERVEGSVDSANSGFLTAALRASE